MVKDKFRVASDGLRMDMSHKHSDTGYKIKGTVFWKLEDTTTGEITEGKMNNIVTLDASILIARLIKSTSIPHVSEPSFGAFAIAVGTGDIGWPLADPPVATASQRSLYNEIARKQISASSFIDSLGNPSSIPTPTLDLTVVYSVAEAVGPLMEMGILGSDINTNMAIQNPVLPANGPYDTSTDTVGKDGLINYISFPVIFKPPTSTYTVTWRLSF